MTMEYVMVSTFLLASLFVLVYSLGQLNLSWYYLQRRKNSIKGKSENEFVKNGFRPKVTVQLPVYNELYVIERLIDAVGELDYPHDLLEIQVLDDSSDETIEIIKRKVHNFQDKGLNIRHIRRLDRAGYKAGALQYGLEEATGDFIAIFDSDFIPGKDFILNTIEHFKDDKIGVVQGCWGHINKDYSLLTKLQAFGLDAHFSVEQGGRNFSGCFMNFNGTGGVWRKTCIFEAGGWSSDTLTEDLDLSYRAQLKGWKFKYLEDVITPAELPVTMAAIKSQQFRWNKGGAETARKNLISVLRSKISLVHKAHAILHLLNSSVYFFLLLALVLSIPMLLLKESNLVISFVFKISGFFAFGFFAIAFFYWVSSRRAKTKSTIKYFFQTFPIFLMVCMGMSLHNTYAVLSGFLGMKSPFVRTPKFNIGESKRNWKENIYINKSVDIGTIFDGIFALYFFFGVLMGVLLEEYWLILFHGMFSFGFAYVFYNSIKEA